MAKASKPNPFAKKAKAETPAADVPPAPKQKHKGLLGDAMRKYGNSTRMDAVRSHRGK